MFYTQDPTEVMKIVYVNSIGDRKQHKYCRPNNVACSSVICNIIKYVRCYPLWHQGETTKTIDQTNNVWLNRGGEAERCALTTSSFLLCYLNFPDEDVLLFGKAKDAREFPN